MKAIDILVEELPKRGGWPDGVVCFAQDVDGFFAGYKRKPTPSYGGIWTSDGYLNDSGWWSKALGCDRETAIITREQYEAALAAKNDGWIEWGGGLIPISTNTFVDVKFNNGDVRLGKIAGEYSWEHVWEDSNIIAYRLHKPRESDLNESIEHDAAPVWGGEGGTPSVGCVCECSWAGNEWMSCKILFVSDQLVVVKLKESDREDAYNIGDVIFRQPRTEAERKRDEVRKAMYAAMDIVDGDIADAIYDAIEAGKIPGVKLED